MQRYCFVLASALLLLAASPALAQPYPNKPIRIFVPFAAGGAVDTLARLLANKLSEQLGQTVLVENRAGAGGNLAPDALAKSPPDGYTVLQTTNGIAISPALYRTLPFDVHKDFVAVTQLVSSQLVFAANPKLEASSIAEFIALAKAKPGGLNYGSTGIGNPLHLTMEMLKSATGINVQPVPYRGDAPLNTALIAGEIQVAVVPMATVLSHLEAGTLKALAIGGAKRSPALPNVPTIMESGVPDYEMSGWFGILAPAGTPPAVAQRLRDEVAKAVAAPDLVATLGSQGMVPLATAPDDWAKYLKSELDVYTKITKEANIKPE